MKRNAASSPIDTIRIGVFLLAMVYGILLIPILHSGFYAHPIMDDFLYGMSVHEAIENGGGILEVLAAAWGYLIQRYYRWQGSFSAVFLFNLMPGAFSGNMYWITPFLMTGSLTLGMLFLFETVWGKVFGRKRIMGIAAGLFTLILMIEFPADMMQAFYWYNGAVYYSFFYGLALVFCALIIRMHLDETGAKRTLAFLLSLIFAPIIAGSNYTTALLTGELMLAVLIMTFLRRDENRKRTAVLTILYWAAFLVSAAAPGNRVRAERYEQMNPFLAILSSLYYTPAVWRLSLTALTPAYILFVLPEAAAAARRSLHRFQMPGAVSIIAVLFYASQMAPVLYGLQNIGAGRQINIYVYAFYPFLLFCLYYWCGWINRCHPKIFSRAAAYRDKLYKVSFAALLVGTILHLNGWAVPQPASLIAERARRQGALESYDRQYRAIESMLLEYDGTDPVSIPEIEQRPSFFGDLNLVENPDKWPNYSVARWYHVPAVVPQRLTDTGEAAKQSAGRPGEDEEPGGGTQPPDSNRKTKKEHGSDKIWRSSVIGDAAGAALIDGNAVIDKPEGFCLPADKTGTISLSCSGGKLSDSQESFVYCYTEIDPKTENFRLSASFTVEDMVGETAEWQAGYGIFAVDTARSEEKSACHRNQLDVGRFRMKDLRTHDSGMRVVAGYSDPEAKEFDEKRILDASRTAGLTGQSPSIRIGETYRFTLQKTDEGFTGSVCFEDQERVIDFPGCDFLMRQDPETIAVGFAVSRDLTVRVSDICFETEAGGQSRTPPEAVRLCIPDYPFSRTLAADRAGRPARGRPGTLFVSPEGRPDGQGLEWDPMDLQTALETADADHPIRLAAGVYRPKEPYLVPSDRKGEPGRSIHLLPPNSGQAVIDGGGLREGLPAFILLGARWQISGLVFRNAPGGGLLVCGDRNVVERCEAYGNGDTGFMLCAFPGTDRRPSHNLVLNCDSHDNCDGALGNADGFGAKMSAGEGNRFVGCIAHHNVDDGFDLYTKSIFGPIGAVRIEDCVAYRNGCLSDGRINPGGHGVGFKLGGENQAAAHVVRNCIAYENREAGFTANSNPSVHISRATAFGNGSDTNRREIVLRTDRTDPDWTLQKTLPRAVRFRSGNEKGWLYSENNGPGAEEKPEEAALSDAEAFVSADTAITPTRRKDGSIDMHGLFTRRQGETAGADLAERGGKDERRRRAQLLQEILAGEEGDGAE